MKKLLLILFIALTSCEKSPDGYRIYRVPAGQHSCTHEPKRYDKHSIAFEFEVNSTWDWGYCPTPSGFSKIYGLGSVNHKENSARLSFKIGQDNEMMLGLYVYADGERHTCIIDTVQYGRYYCEISRENNEWIYRVNGKIGRLPAGKKYIAGVVLFPYVGGEYTISKEWVVLINQK